jgi:hypothetical protein
MAGNFSQAGSALTAGFGGSAAGAAGTALPSALGTAGAAPGGWVSQNGLNVLAAEAAPMATQAAAPGMLAKLASSPYAAPALIQAGSGMLSGLAQGKQMEAASKQKYRDEENDRARYNVNVGTRLWGKP